MNYLKFFLFLLLISGGSFIKDVLSQSKMGINAGLVYVGKSSDREYNVSYSSKSGYLVDAFYYFSAGGLDAGAEAGYKTKGARFRTIGYNTEYQTSFNYLSLMLSGRKIFYLTRDLNLFLKAGPRVDFLLSDFDSFRKLYVGGPEPMKTVFYGFSFGTGFEINILNPSLLVDISVSPDITHQGSDDVIRSTSIELKLGIQFDGFQIK